MRNGMLAQAQACSSIMGAVIVEINFNDGILNDGSLPTGLRKSLSCVLTLCV